MIVINRIIIKAGKKFVAEGRLILASNVAKEEKTAFWVVEKK